MTMLPHCLLIALALCCCPLAAALPTLTVTEDDTRIDRSCVVRIPPGAVIADADGDGVLHVVASDVTVVFASGSVLRGAPEGTPWDALRGVGVSLEGVRGVTLRGLRVSGFKAGVVARRCDGLTIDGGAFVDNFRQRLGSTAAREDPRDWLSPHRNDGDEWLSRYGAAVYVGRSRAVTVRGVRVRRGQNGLVLSRVERSRIFDNDASFLSGWGLAMWRASHNVVARNAFDACVRGHSEGVYNRGQDSAGILMFEQCSNNVIAHNSATHGGDGVFGFAGLEALDADAPRAGCNDNLFLANDLSYAAAHGWEMTFSFGNRLLGNRLVGNAICGVWGGFSQRTLIARNTFADNGGMGYGLERGGVDIEHGVDNRILGNRFTNDRAAVHLWWDALGGMADKPWRRHNYADARSTGTVVAGNTFVIEPAGDRRVVLHLRDDGEGRLGPVRYVDNTVRVAAPAVALDGDAALIDASGEAPEVPALPAPELPGTSRPVGARARLRARGRRAILMTAWGPWDHASPALRPMRRDAGRVVHQLLGFGEAAGTTPDGVRARCASPGVLVELGSPSEGWPHARTLTIRGARPGVVPYQVRVDGRGRDGSPFSRTLAGTLIALRWRGVFFRWDADCDPRASPKAWLARARGADAVPFEADAIAFDYGMRGPSDLGVGQVGAAVRDAHFAPDRFGMVARCAVPLPAGRWKLSTTSDDGVRLFADGAVLIDDWTWHAPKRHEAVLTLKRARTVQLELRHFEIDGAAVLRLEIAPAE